jgi:hypothetical protein
VIGVTSIRVRAHFTRGARELYKSRRVGMGDFAFACLAEESS